MTQPLWDRLWASQQVPHGKARITVLEDVLRDADILGAQDLRYAARIFITGAYQQGGEPAKAFVPFSWCLAVYDRGEADPRWNGNLYWFFKFMVGSMTGFPEMPLERTYAVLDDMERRYRLAGHTLNPVHQYRAMLARHVGDRETAAEQYRLWSATPRGDMSDCIGCEPSDKVGHLSWLGRYADAVEVAAPVLGGTFTCVEQPQDILTSLLLPYVHTGRFEDAARAHRQAYRAIRHDPAQLREIATHVEFCALTGNHARGLDLVERHLGWLDAAPTPFAELEFAASAALNLRLVAESGHASAPVRRPEGEISVAALRDELTERALAIAARFDVRNGTSEQGDRIRRLLAAEPLVDQLPLSGPPPAVVTEPTPSTQDLPVSPAELAALAERQGPLGGPAEAIWAKFDEVCPEPDGELLARRLSAAADMVADRDQDAAERDYERSAALFAEAGNAVKAKVSRGKITLMRSLTGERADGAAELAAVAERIAALGDVKNHGIALLRLAYFRYIQDDAVGAREVLERAEEPVRAGGSAGVLGQWLELHANVLASVGELAPALELSEAAATAFIEAGGPNRTARVRLQAGRLHAALGDLDRAFATVSGIEDCTDRLVRGRLNLLRGQLATDLGRPGEAPPAFSSAAADLDAAGSPVEGAAARVDLALACLNLDRPEEAADAAQDAEPVLARAGVEHELARARFLLGKAYRGLDRREQALRQFGPVVEHFVTAGNPGAAGEATENVAMVLDELDRDAESAAEFVKAAEFYGEAGLVADELRCLRRAPLLWHWAGDERALDALAAAERLAETAEESAQVAWERAMTAYDGARLLANLDRPADALSRATIAAKALRGMGANAEAAVAEVLRGRLLRDLGKPAEARAALTTALADLPEAATHQRSEVGHLLATLD